MTDTPPPEELDELERWCPDGEYIVKETGSHVRIPMTALIAAARERAAIIEHHNRMAQMVSPGERRALQAKEAAEKERDELRAILPRGAEANLREVGEDGNRRAYYWERDGLGYLTFTYDAFVKTVEYDARKYKAAEARAEEAELTVWALARGYLRKEPVTSDYLGFPLHLSMRWVLTLPPSVRPEIRAGSWSKIPLNEGVLPALTREALQELARLRGGS